MNSSKINQHRETRPNIKIRTGILTLTLSNGNEDKVSRELGATRGLTLMKIFN